MPEEHPAAARARTQPTALLPPPPGWRAVGAWRGGGCGGRHGGAGCVTRSRPAMSRYIIIRSRRGVCARVPTHARRMDMEKRDKKKGKRRRRKKWAARVLRRLLFPPRWLAAATLCTRTILYYVCWCPEQPAYIGLFVGYFWVLTRTLFVLAARCLPAMLGGMVHALLSTRGVCGQRRVDRLPPARCHFLIFPLFPE